MTKSKTSVKKIAAPAAATIAQRLQEAREHDPFSVLGLHAAADAMCLRVFRPHAQSISVQSADATWQPLIRPSARGACATMVSSSTTLMLSCRKRRPMISTFSTAVV